jgi:adenylate cyclase
MTMADLIAQGTQRQDRWRRQVPTDETIVLGREEGIWAVPWDRQISRRHAELRWQAGGLLVRAEPGATNPVFFRGQPQKEFQLAIGEHFVIGTTAFTLADEQVKVSLELPHPVTEQLFTAEYLRHLAFRDARQQIEALSRLPDLVAGADSDQELCVRLVNLLLTGVSQATAVAVARAAPTASPDAQIEILHWDRAVTSGESFQPSGPLIREAIRQQQSVVHLRQGTNDPEGDAWQESSGWAFCTPVPGSSCRGWAVYVAGHPPTNTRSPLRAEDLQDALKFVELAASTLGSVCDVRLLQRRAAALGQFFSPPVREVVASSDPNVVLAPRETDVAVLFCDLRGFSRSSEQSAHDLFGLLRRVSESLGTMTRLILEYGGVIGDFHGDAAMGFWGWPLPQSDLTIRACRAALAIRTAFEDAASQDQHALAGFCAGMGLATGRAVAGKIGTSDQVKVTAFGPVVNLAARLEGMTRLFETPILVDQATADVVTSQMSAAEAHIRLLAWVRPYGLQADLPVYELAPGRTAAAWRATDHRYQVALNSFRRGAWNEARPRLQSLADHVAAARLLLRYMSEHADQPPRDWDGVIPLGSK